MTIRFTSARIILPDEGRILDGDLVIKDGIIAAFGAVEQPPDATDQCIDCRGTYLAPGIIDAGVKIGEPGERYKESFRTAGLAAIHGGITTLITRPDTTPPIDQPEMLEFFIRRALAATPVKVRPMATLTKGRDGQELAEIGLLSDAGAIGFSDCDSFVADSRVMANCMQYCQQIGALVVGHPQDPWLSNGAAVTSGKFATLSGLPAVSPVAEKIGLERDLSLAQATGCKYHADQVTTDLGLATLERAIRSGVDASAGVSIHHLTLNALDVADYRTFFKIKPPLRSEDDRLAVVAAVAANRIGIISSMHTPQDEESKRLPFAEAASGAAGLETLFPAALKLYHDGALTLPDIFRSLSSNPAQRFGLTGGVIRIGAPADIIQFETDTPFILDRFTLQSKSKNTPYDGDRMQGRILRTLIDGTIVYERPADGP